MKETIVTKHILSRDLNGKYKIWAEDSEISLVNGCWLGMALAGYYNTAMVEKYLGVKFPSVSISIAFGSNVEIEVVKVIQTAVKHMGEVRSA